jgi:hypothetical protein
MDNKSNKSNKNNKDNGINEKDNEYQIQKKKYEKMTISFVSIAGTIPVIFASIIIANRLFPGDTLVGGLIVLLGILIWQLILDIIIYVFKDKNGDDDNTDYL